MTKQPVLFAMLSVLLAAAAARADLKPTVEAEEEVYRCANANNGSGPSWCFGSSCIARIGEDVFASGMEVIPDAKPLNNTRWLIFKRNADGWKLAQKDETGRTREPSPIGVLPDAGAVLLSVNPTLTPKDQYSGPARPEILRFSTKALTLPSPGVPGEGSSPQILLPVWDGQPKFTEHSYRSFAVDGAKREMILMQNIGYTHSEWSFCDSTGKWSARGKPPWPFGAEYAKPEPIRVCYPTVQLRNRAVYFCGVSDIVEPNPAWREYKLKLTKQNWDYDFRRLFFTYCPDITTGKFAPWIEVASREKTAGWIYPCDLYADDKGLVHILWTERALDTRLRKDFFPNEKQSEALNYAVIEGGKVIFQKPILIGGEGQGSEIPGRGRFHIMPDNRLLVFFYVSGRNAAGQGIAENRLIEIRPDRTFTAPVRVPLQRAVSTFFTTTPRAGSVPSNTLDILADSGGSMRYARVKVAE